MFHNFKVTIKNNNCSSYYNKIVSTVVKDTFVGNSQKISITSLNRLLKK